MEAQCSLSPAYCPSLMPSCSSRPPGILWHLAGACCPAPACAFVPSEFSSVTLVCLSSAATQNIQRKVGSLSLRNTVSHTSSQLPKISSSAQHPFDLCTFLWAESTVHFYAPGPWALWRSPYPRILASGGPRNFPQPTWTTFRTTRYRE